MSVALNRIEKLLDPGSFVQVGAAVTARATDFSREPGVAPGDGVITGHGLVDGNLVFVYSQDDKVLGGSLGEMHAKKILAIYDMARKTGAPVVGMLSSSGIRVLESVDAAESLGEVLHKMAVSSGVIPMISAVFGKLGGGMAVIPALSDMTFMEDKSNLFITPPDAIEGVNKDKFDPSSPVAQAENTGVVDFVGNEDEIIAQIRNLITLLPGSSVEEGRVEESRDDLNRILDASLKDADTKDFITALADNGLVFYYKPEYSRSMTCAIIRMGGRTVGVVANNRKDKKVSPICARCTRKAAEFIGFLDAFDIPVLTITDVSGYKNELSAEYGLPAALAKLSISLANADCAKINLLRSGKSSAYVFMNSKSMGADIVYSYDDAKLEIMEASELAGAMAEAGAGDKADIENRLKKEVFGAVNAARRGYVDSVIDFADTRKFLIAGFDMLYTKNTLPYRKHEAR